MVFSLASRTRDLKSTTTDTEAGLLRSKAIALAAALILFAGLIANLCAQALDLLVLEPGHLLVLGLVIVSHQAPL